MMMVNCFLEANSMLIFSLKSFWLGNHGLIVKHHTILKDITTRSLPPQCFRLKGNVHVPLHCQFSTVNCQSGKNHDIFRPKA